MIYSERANHFAAFINNEGTAEKLKRIPFMSATFNEAWLQELLESNPFLVPSADVSSLFSPLVCIGLEVPVGSGETKGYIDNLYITPTGHIVIVETKLFRNQESRRTVVAQVIDYAKELQGWDCEKLNAFVKDYTYHKFGQSYTIIDLMVEKGHLTYSDEAKLNDSINANLSNAAFLLMIIGDGIRSNVQQLAEFLNDNTKMSFNLALAEIELYQTENGIIAIPNILTKTQVVERTIQGANYKNTIFCADNEVEQSSYIRKPILSRREFVDTFANNGGYNPDEITEFLCDLEAIDGVSINIAPTELAIRVSVGPDKAFTLITFGISGNRSDVWITPNRIKAYLEKFGKFPFDADEFLDSYKAFINLDKCKFSPYEELSSFYYADVDKLLSSPKQFISAVEQFIAYIN